MARLNTVVERPAKTTHEGGPAKHITPIAQLRRSLLACMLWEDTFYEDGVDIAQRIHDEVAAVLKSNDAQVISDLAVEARTQFKLRHAPLWLTLALVKSGIKSSIVSQTIASVIQRPDELAELLAMYWKDGKKPLSRQLKKGLAMAFTKFDRYALSKYANREAAIKLRDVLFLVHPKPVDELQAELWKELAAKTLTAPDTWESNLSAGADKKDTWERLINERKLGALAMLRNLRNMQQAEVPFDTIRKGLREMKTERVLPFRFITAAKYAPMLEPELEETMFKCLAGMDKLSGHTVLCVDNSPSMYPGYSVSVSKHSELTRVDAACALAMLLREIGERVTVIAFSSTSTLVPSRRGFALRDAIQKTESNGTDIDTAVAHANAIAGGYDRIIVMTDEQTVGRVRDPHPGSKAYMVNVSTTENGVGYGRWTHIDGWSEAIVEYIVDFEKPVQP